jgi:hypothetical protein
MVKEEGVLAFWKGHMSAQYLSAIYMTIQFTGVDAFTRKAHKTFPNAHESKFQTSFIMGCGGVFGATMATSVSFPFDVIRTRTIAQHTTNLKAQCCSVSFWQRAWHVATRLRDSRKFLEIFKIIFFSNFSRNYFREIRENR